MTCVVHNGEVDVTDTVELPNGPCCVRCFLWMESLMDDDPDADDDELTITIELLDDDELDDDDDF